MNNSRVGAIAAFMQNYSAQACSSCPQIPVTCPDHAPPATFCDHGVCQYVTPYQ